MHEAELRRRLGLAYGALGQRTHLLVNAGTLAEEPLAPELQHVRELEAELTALTAERVASR